MTPEEIDKSLRKIRAIELERKELMKSISKPFLQIDHPIFALPKIDFSIFQPYNIDFSVFKFPNVSFPKIDFPEIDYERIREITDDNSKFGWTLTGEMSFGDYLEDDLVGVSAAEKDEYFYTYYSKNDWEHFGYMKKEILEEIEPRWIDLIQECFESFGNDKYKIIIPTLFTIIEGEMSFVFQSHDGSNAIIKRMETEADNVDSKMKQISLYSVVHSMKDQLFGSFSFAEDRNDLINRHRVLHGRDIPSHWQKVDALRLLNVISSLQFIKDILKEKE